MKKYILTNLLIATLLGIQMGCGVEDPEPENESEIITTVRLTFTPVTGGQAVVVEASDPDGEGPESIVTNSFTLAANTNYTLGIEFEDDINGEDITEEVKEEADEHLILFSWTEGMFTNPTGNGNIDNRVDPVNYLDFDGDNLELGIETEWTTAEASTGEFRLVLKHQPGLKTETSGINDGESDVDVTFPFVIQ